MSIHTAVMRGIADRSTDVAAGFQPGQSCCECGRRAARRTARYPCDIPRVVGGAVDVVERPPVGKHGRHIGLAEDDRAWIDVALPRDCITRRTMILELGQAPGRRHARYVE